MAEKTLAKHIRNLRSAVYRLTDACKELTEAIDSMEQSQSLKAVLPALQTAHAPVVHTTQLQAAGNPLWVPAEKSPSTFPEIRCSSAPSLRDHLEAGL